MTILQKLIKNFHNLIGFTTYAKLEKTTPKELTVKNFFQRAITAAAFVAVLLSCTFYSHITFTALFTLITLLGTWEFYKLVEKDGATRPQRVMGAVTAGVMFVTNAVFSMTQMNIRVLLFIFSFITQ